MKRVKIRTRDIRFSYNGTDILQGSSMDFAEHTISAIVGPSGSGKSTFLLTLNRLWEAFPECSMEGEVSIHFNGSFHNIYQKGYDVNRLRRKVGMVFQAPNPLPISIYRNIVFPLKLAGIDKGEETRILVEESLRKAGLWSEVKDRLDSSALELSGGQQQRLCIARALILQPEILLLDEPTSSLDSQAAATIEELLLELKENCTIVVVSHYLDQVRRIADSVVTMENGKLMPIPAASSKDFSTCNEDLVSVGN